MPFKACSRKTDNTLLVTGLLFILYQSHFYFIAGNSNALISSNKIQVTLFFNSIKCITDRGIEDLFACFA